MATEYVLWDRTKKEFAGGNPPIRFKTSPDASQFNDRYNGHDPKKNDRKVFDVVSVTT